MDSLTTYNHLMEDLIKNIFINIDNWQLFFYQQLFFCFQIFHPLKNWYSVGICITGGVPLFLITWNMPALYIKHASNPQLCGYKFSTLHLSYVASPFLICHRLYNCRKIVVILWIFGMWDNTFFHDCRLSLCLAKLKLLGLNSGNAKYIGGSMATEDPVDFSFIRNMTLILPPSTR